MSFVDYLTPQNYTFSVFFIIPVAVSTWLLGRREGVIVSVISVASLVVAHLVHANIYGNAWFHAWNAFSQLVVLLTITYILAALHRSNAHEAALARSDPLTGIANRRSFTELGEYEVHRAERFHQSLSFVYMDIDNFKEVNDTYGHQAGDDLLKAVAHTIRNNVRSVDSVARLGGDEFAVILPSAGYEETNEAVRRMHAKLQSIVRGRKWKTGFSIGALTCMVSHCSIEGMLKAADDLMYEVKRTGKNSYKHMLMQESPAEKKTKEAIRK